MKNLNQHSWIGPDKKEDTASKQIAERVMAGETFQKALQIPEGTIQEFYDYSQELLGEGRYEDAGAVLFIITLICPDRPGVWISYGNCRHILKEFNGARAAYNQASLLAPELLEPYVYAAQCAIGMYDDVAALDYLKQMEDKGKARKEDAQIIALAKHLKEELTHAQKTTA